MSIAESEFPQSRDPRLAALLIDHATGTLPAWLWRADGSCILWANAIGAAIFGAADVGDAASRRFDAKQPAAAAIIRLASTLPPSGQGRLERLRGFGASFGRTLTCLCSRFALADGSAAVLVVAGEPAGAALPLRERVSRIFSDQTRTLAVFAPDGSLLAATAAARSRLGGSSTLSALGISEIATQALAAGSASGVSDRGQVDIRRLGTDASTVLAVAFGPLLSETGRAASALEKKEAVMASAEPPIAAPSARVEAQSPHVVPSHIDRHVEAPAAASVEPAPVETASSVEPARVESAPVAAVAQTPQASRAQPHSEPSAERRHPLRFVWQADADGRFVVGSDEFTELMGPQTTAAFGRLWSEIAADLKLDPSQDVARAIATRETWSGITVSWPVDDGERLPVELSGLPVFDRERRFRGYRGFGVCRDVARINQLAHARRERPIGFMAPPDAAPEGDKAAITSPQSSSSAETEAPGPIKAEEPIVSPAAVEETVVSSATVEETPPAPPPPPERTAPTLPPAANVVLFRPGTAAASSEPKTPSLSPVERKAFRELAQELTARLHGGREPANAESDVAAPQVESAVVPETEEIGANERGEAPATAPAEEAQKVPVEAAAQTSAEPAPAPATEAAPASAPEFASAPETSPALEPALLDRIPIGVLIYQNDSLLYANHHFLELTGYQSLDALTAAGWLRTLVAETDAGRLKIGGNAHALSLTTVAGERCDVEARLFAVPWGDSGSALALILTSNESIERQRAAALSLSAAENQIRELATKLDSVKKSEEELRAATREAQRAAAAKAGFIGKVSHEIRTPLNTITGFTEVMMAERFGPIGNERYREYLKDVHGAGMHIVALLNDLLDLSKIESGQLGLNFANVSLNDLTQQCVGLMQPQASRARIIIRTSLTPGLPQVVADERSLRQIVLNLLSNSIRFTGPGGQVIVSTAFADSGEAVLRVRDTGAGMNEKDVQAALEPFRQTATAGSWGSGGTGLGLPLTKALAEANRAHFSIQSAPNAGTLIEVAFPRARVVAQ